MEEQPAEQPVEQPTEEQPAPKSREQSDDKATKIMFGIVFLIVMIGVMTVLKLMPFCKGRCSNGVTMAEIVVAPILICLSTLAAGAFYRMAKKIPEKRSEIIHSNEVPNDMMVRMLVTSYIISVLVFLVPSLIYIGIMRDQCGNAEYKNCGSGVNIPYYAFFFPVTSLLAVYLSYKLTYRLWVPLFKVGEYPNGKPIFKRKMPSKIKMMTIGASVFAIVMMLLVSIITVNSF